MNIQSMIYGQMDDIKIWFWGPLSETTKSETYWVNGLKGTSVLMVPCFVSCDVFWGASLPLGWACLSFTWLPAAESPLWLLRGVCFKVNEEVAVTIKVLPKATSQRSTTGRNSWFVAALRTWKWNPSPVVVFNVSAVLIVWNVLALL